MKEGDRVRVINPGPAAYAGMSSVADEFLYGREGRLKRYTVDEAMEVGWYVHLDGGIGYVFLLECEIEKIGESDGSETIDLPEWWRDKDAIRMLLLRVEVEHEPVRTVFGPYFNNLGEVYLHLQSLGMETNDDNHSY